MSYLSKGYSLVYFCLFLGLLSCSKKSTDTIEEDNFPRRDMLANFADNLVTPSLEDFRNKTAKLYSTTQKFTSSPSQASLDSLQVALDSTFVSWQYCSWFRYGSASTYFGATEGIPRKDEINTYPASKAKIEAYIASGDYSLNNSDLDARGLNALDYLIYPSAGDSENEIISRFDSSTKRKAYLEGVAFQLQEKAQNAYLLWLNEKGIFFSADGKDAASSTSLVALYWDVDYEAVKNYKLGIPVGRIQAGQTLSPYPETVEAYYSGMSVNYLRHNLKALENLLYGRSRSEKEGLGYDDYLRARNATEVMTNIAAQLAVIKSKIDSLPSAPLSELIKTDKQKVQDLYLETLKLTRFVKSDMVSRLSLSISYASGDGD